MPSLTRSKPRRPELDWQGARERLARAALDRTELDATERDRVLAERARALARKPAVIASLRRDDTPDSALELLQFQWGKERYALESRYVHQVLVPGELTRLPGTPAHLRGVTNLRGEILPVFDVREWFDVEREAPSDRSRWLVLGTDEPELCLSVDGVSELCFVAPHALSAPDRDERAKRGLVRGVTNDAHTVFDGARLLAHPDLFIGDALSVTEEATL